MATKALLGRVVLWLCDCFAFLINLDLEKTNAEREREREREREKESCCSKPLRWSILSRFEQYTDLI